MVTMKVEVDWDLCEGHGLCAIEAPEVFELRELDQVTLLEAQPPEDQRAGVETAVRFCPKSAITVKD
jgi:ferredoxin